MGDRERREKAVGRPRAPLGYSSARRLKSTDRPPLRRSKSCISSSTSTPIKEQLKSASTACLLRLSASASRHPSTWYVPAPLCSSILRGMPTYCSWLRALLCKCEYSIVSCALLCVLYWYAPTYCSCFAFALNIVCTRVHATLLLI